MQLMTGYLNGFNSLKQHKREVMHILHTIFAIQQGKVAEIPRPISNAQEKRRQKDSITGMRIGNGLTILSDKVYTYDSPEIVRLIGEFDGTFSPDGSREWEFEFSKKAVIISTKTTG